MLTIQQVSKKFSGKRKPYFDKDGNFYIPTNFPFGGEITPTLKPKEWFYFVLSLCDEIPEYVKPSLVGSKSTQYRTHKKLIKKGYTKKI